MMNGRGSAAMVRKRLLHLGIAATMGAACSLLITAPEAVADNCSPQGCNFASPSRHMYCFMMDDNSGENLAACRWIDFGPPLQGHGAYLSADGNLSTEYYDPGDASLCEDCFRNGVNRSVLPYGTTATWGALTCASETDGFTCTTSRTGHGFRINASGIFPV